jgi:hypothetical protein
MMIVLTLASSDSSNSINAPGVARDLSSHREDPGFCRKYLSETLGIYELSPELVLELLSKRRDGRQQ